MNTPNARIVRSPRGPEKTAKTWAAEAAMRMLMNNLDPEVAERPQDLVVYGGIGKAARDWAAFDQIVESLQTLEADAHRCRVELGQPITPDPETSGQERRARPRFQAQRQRILDLARHQIDAGKLDAQRLEHERVV